MRHVFLVVVGCVMATWIAIAQQERPVTDDLLRMAPAKGEEWLTYGVDQGERRFSPLSQINVNNVGRLGLAWSYDIPGTLGNPPGGGIQQATPLMWNGTLYGITTWSVVFAVDARTGRHLWSWDPQVNRAAVQPKLCCGVVNRGLALYQGTIIAPIIDGRLVALNASTGRPVWESRVAYPQDQYTLTMAPRIAKGKVFIGASGAEYPVRGFLDAYDARTGARVWRFYTVPGDPSKGFESETMRKAAATWDGEWWKMGGGATVWDGLSYDPEADLIYFGTGNGGPWPEVLRGSKGKDNLFVASIIALRPDTGQLAWYYQTTPGDWWDYDSVQQLVLADLTIDGRNRRVLMQANKNGFYYILDRITGELISAEPYTTMSWATGIDRKTGRPVIRPESYYGSEQPVTLSPSTNGARNWSPMSFHPGTGLVYMPTTLGGSSTFRVLPDFEFQEGAQNWGIVRGRGRGAAPPGAAAPAPPTPPVPEPVVPPTIGPSRDGARGGALIAWDPVAQRERWHRTGGGATGGGTFTTAGNLVFQVVGDGRLLAYTADTGTQVLELQTYQRGGMGPPITYAIDGVQYVTLMGGRGVGPAPPAPGAAPVPGAPAPATAGAPPAAPPIPGAPPRMLTFVLDGKARLPEQP